jgi:hypothetical protein
LGVSSKFIVLCSVINYKKFNSLSKRVRLREVVNWVGRNIAAARFGTMLARNDVRS